MWQVVELTEEDGDEVIDLLANKYRGVDRYPFHTPEETRVTVLIEPTKVFGQVRAGTHDAAVETLEIIDGVMQQPTAPIHVAWYKETGRLGEPNNVVIAGHLNRWNVPEGVFFRLQDLQEGDRVEVTGDDGRVYVYEVQCGSARRAILSRRRPT